MTASRALARATHVIVTRRCTACRHRYRRRLPNCPVCKVRPGHDGLDTGHRWAAGIGFGL